MAPALSLHALRPILASRWLIAAMALAAWIVVLVITKRILLALLKHMTRSPHLHYLHPMLEAISPALNIAIVVGGIKVASQIAPIPDKWQPDVNIILIGGVIAALVVFANSISRLWLRHAASHYSFFNEGYGIITGALSGLIIALGVLMFLESVGVSIGPLLASLGIGSLAIAIALQETFKNIFSGFFLIVDKPLQVGDFVKLETGQEGQLFKLGWRSSKFRMLSNEIVVVPNSQLVDSIVTNFRGADGNVMVPIGLVVLNTNDPVRVEHLVADVAHEVSSALSQQTPASKPQILFGDMSGNALNLTVLIPALSSDSIPQVRNDFLKRVLARFGSEAIKLPA
jgi:small-conductance mechanosensitive channel